MYPDVRHSLFPPPLQTRTMDAMCVDTGTPVVLHTLDTESECVYAHGGIAHRCRRSSSGIWHIAERMTWLVSRLKSLRVREQRKGSRGTAGEGGSARKKEKKKERRDRQRERD
jgi:hypothetical protein